MTVIHNTELSGNIQFSSVLVSTHENAVTMTKLNPACLRLNLCHQVMYGCIISSHKIIL